MATPLIDRFLVPRDPDAPILTRRFIDRVADVLNSLMLGGFLTPIPGSPSGGVGWTIPGVGPLIQGNFGPMPFLQDPPSGDNAISVPFTPSMLGLSKNALLYSNGNTILSAQALTDGTLGHFAFGPGTQVNVRAISPGTNCSIFSNVSLETAEIKTQVIGTNSEIIYNPASSAAAAQVFSAVFGVRTKSGNTQPVSYLVGCAFGVDHFGSGAVSVLEGIGGYAQNDSSGAVGSAYSFLFSTSNLGSGSIGTAYGTYGYVYNNGPGTITNAYTHYADYSGGVGHTNVYGYFCADYAQTPASGDNYNFYSEDVTGSSKNYLGGQVGIGELNPYPSAKLEITSTTQGFLLPRMTTTQRNAISSPAEGLRVYDTTLHVGYIYNGTAWVADGPGPAGAMGPPGMDGGGDGGSSNDIAYAQATTYQLIAKRLLGSSANSLDIQAPLDNGNCNVRILTDNGTALLVIGRNDEIQMTTNFRFTSDNTYNVGRDDNSRPQGLYSATYIWAGKGGAIPTLLDTVLIAYNSSATTTAASILARLIGRRSQTGVKLQLCQLSSTDTGREQADFDAKWVDETDATRKAKAIIRVWDTSAREAIVSETDGARATTKVPAGSSTGYARIGGASFDHFADGSSSHTDGTEDDLYSDTTAAATLSVNGDKVEATYAGVIVGHATATRKIKVYFAGTAILDTTALVSASNSNWVVQVKLIRVSATVVRYWVLFTDSGLASTVPAAVGELTGLTLSGTNILKITGAAAGVGAASADIVAKMGSVDWKPAA